LAGGLTREQALNEAEAIARDKALASGAVADTIVAVEREDVPLAYLPGNATRIRVKVVGDIEI
jgi:N-methylhydantoinase A/oxoprolinase/acetone carboxylase beta subunit